MTRPTTIEPRASALRAEENAVEYEVSLSPAPETASLAAQWSELESRAGGSFFTSWSWIGNWVEMIRPRFAPLLLRVEAGGHVVGLGLLVPRRRLGVLPVRQLLLHATGDSELDELTVEYNGLLAEKGLEAPVARAAFGHLLAHEPGWDECLVDGASTVVPLEGLSGAAAELRASRRSACFGVELASLERGRYVDSLDKTTRYNVRRSLRDFAARGPVSLDQAATLTEALEFLARLRDLHQVYWRKRGRPGSYASSFFAAFHERLVASAFPSGGVQLLRLRAGDVVIGYTYNLVHRGWVCQYSSGFDYELFPGRSPGVVAHALSVEHNASLGHRVYDLMAGDAKYKRQLGSPISDLAWIALRRRRLKFRVEDGLRVVWRALRAGALPASQPPQARPGRSE